MGDHGLIDAETAPGALDTGEARRHRARHNHTSHFDPAVDNDLLDVVAEVRHSGKRVPPNRLLIVDCGGGKTERRVDYHVAVQQLIEGVEIARITGSQPSKHHRLASIDHRTKLTVRLRAHSASGVPHTMGNQHGCRRERHSVPLRE
jgi:hypothetical protein